MPIFSILLLSCSRPKIKLMSENFPSSFSSSARSNYYLWSPVISLRTQSYPSSSNRPATHFSWSSLWAPYSPLFQWKFRWYSIQRRMSWLHLCYVSWFTRSLRRLHFNLLLILLSTHSSCLFLLYNWTSPRDYS